jgi:hypothetical protein
MTRATRLRVLLLALAGAALLGLLYWPEAPEREWAFNPNYLPQRLIDPPASTTPTGPVAAAAPAPYSDTLVRRLLTPLAGWHSAAQVESDSVQPPNDLGHGTLAPNIDLEARSGFPYGDTVFFRAAPDTSAEVVGALAFVLETSGSLVAQAVWAPRTLTSNSVELSADEVGIPYDSVDASGRWHRAILGFTDDDKPWLGWTMLGDSVLGRTVWKERLAETMLYFRDFDSGDFHAAPGGRVVATARELAKGGFDITGGEVRGQWMRVTVEHPGENCEGELPANRRADQYWIRAFDERGRPRVFYFTRGC